MGPYKGNKSKIQAMNIIFLRSNNGKTRMDTIKNKTFQREEGIQNLAT
jgi:hypothetical protein